MQIYVKTLIGETMTIEVSSLDETVGDIKTKIKDHDQSKGLTVSK